jgi:hypothetical protein
MISTPVSLASFWLPILLWLLFTVLFFVVLYYVIKRAVLTALRSHAASSAKIIEDDMP